VKYAFIEQHEREFRVVVMCRVLGVSTSGYYDWRRRGPSQQAQRRAVLDELIRDAFFLEKCRAGSPRVYRRLKAAGIQVGEDLVAKRMKVMGLRAKAKRKFKATTNSNHKLPVAPNLLNRDFAASAPNQKWVGDITYLATPEGWLYLAVFIDLYSRKVVGWSMSERMTSDLVCDALKMAWFRCKRPSGVIVHTDRGSQYCSGAFQALLRKYGMRSSMSRKGDCWDNAVAESFFHSFKVEAVQGEVFASRAAMRKAVFEYVEVYYNRQRLHSALGYMSPEQFEARKVA
jgi:transposase InsO family protein